MSKLHEPLPVAGYKPQPLINIDLVNGHKEAEERLLRHLDNLLDVRLHPGIDKRWLAIGRTHLEQAFMAINRAVFQPQRITLPEDPQHAVALPVDPGR